MLSCKNLIHFDYFWLQILCQQQKFQLLNLSFKLSHCKTNGHIVVDFTSTDTVCFETTVTTSFVEINSEV